MDSVDTDASMFCVDTQSLAISGPARDVRAQPHVGKIRPQSRKSYRNRKQSKTVSQVKDGSRDEVDPPSSAVHVKERVIKRSYCRYFVSTARKKACNPAVNSIIEWPLALSAVRDF